MSGHFKRDRWAYLCSLWMKETKQTHILSFCVGFLQYKQTLTPNISDSELMRKEVVKDIYLNLVTCYFGLRWRLCLPVANISENSTSHAHEMLPSGAELWTARKSIAALSWQSPCFCTRSHSKTFTGSIIHLIMVVPHYVSFLIRPIKKVKTKKMKCKTMFPSCDTLAATVLMFLLSNNPQWSNSESAACSTHHTSLITRSLNIECDIFSPQLFDCPIYLWEQMFEMPVHGDASPRFLACALIPLIQLHGFKCLCSGLEWWWRFFFDRNLWTLQWYLIFIVNLCVFMQLFCVYLLNFFSVHNFLHHKVSHNRDYSGSGRSPCHEE